MRFILRLSYHHKCRLIVAMVRSGSVNSWEFRGCSNSAQGRDKKDNFVERVRRGLPGVDWVTLTISTRASPSIQHLAFSVIKTISSPPPSCLPRKNMADRTPLRKGSNPSSRRWFLCRQVESRVLEFTQKLPLFSLSFSLISRVDGE